MAVWRYDKNPKIRDGRHLYVFYIDSEEDLESLPTSSKATKDFEKCAQGSLAVLFGDGEGLKLFGLNGKDEWVEL